ARNWGIKTWLYAPRGRDPITWARLIAALNTCRCRDTISLGDAVRSSARTSAPEPEERPLGVRRSQGGCAVVGGRGLAVSAQPTKKVGSGGVERVVVVEVQLVHQSERCRRALDLGDGDGAVEGHHRRGGDRDQLVVQGDYLRPVGLLDCRSIRMDGVDGGLDLIRTGLVAAKTLAD